MQQVDFLANVAALRLQRLQLFRQSRVVIVHGAVGNQLQQPADLAADLCLPLLGSGEPALPVSLGGGGAFDVSLQDDLEPLRREQPVGQVLDHHPVQRRHADRAAGAEALALLRASGTGVVAVAPGLAGADRHAAVAAAAAGEAGQ